VFTKVDQIWSRINKFWINQATN